MSKAEWGLKRICPSCGTRYYDMKKNPPVCQSCGTAFDSDTLVRSRRGRAAADKKAAATAAVVPEVVIDELPLEEGDEAEDAVIEDAEELGEDVVEEVVEVADDET